MTTATLSRPNGRGSIGVPELVGQPPIVCDGIDLEKPTELENVYTLDGGSGHLTQLTDVPGAGDVSPAWSPGHDRVAFGRRIAGDTQLVIHEIRHGIETTYPEASGNACDWIIPSVLVYAGGNAGERIFVLNLSTRRVTPIAQAEPGSAFVSLDWNPKGGLAVTRRAGSAPLERRDVVVFPPALVRTAAHSRRILTVEDAVPVTGAAACDSPAWSPDGRLLAVRTQGRRTEPDGAQPDDWAEIAVVDLAGGDWTRVIDAATPTPRRAGIDSSPTFSPDGRFLAWLRGDGDEAIQVVVTDVAAIANHEPASGLATWTIAHKHVPAHQYRSLDW